MESNTTQEQTNQNIELSENDYIAFGFNYNGGEPSEILVSNITKVYSDKVLVHFLYGHHSLGEFIYKKDIIAIGNNNSSGKIKGYRGNFEILLPNHPLLEI